MLEGLVVFQDRGFRLYRSVKLTGNVAQLNIDHIVEDVSSVFTRKR